MTTGAIAARTACRAGIRGGLMLVLAAFLLPLLVPSQQAMGQIVLDAVRVNGGGGIASGGNFAVVCSVGEASAGPVMSGGQYSFTPGFINNGTVLPPAICQADFNRDGIVNADDLSDYVSGYFSAPPDPSCDTNGDGTVTSDDLSDFVTAFFSGC